MVFQKTCLFLAFSLLSFYSVNSQIINTVNAPCTEDTYIQSGSTANNSTGNLIYSDITSTYVRRMYLKFDIASLNLPANAIVFSASIKLRLNVEAVDVNATSYVVQRATSTWSESTITYAAQPSLETSDATNFSSKVSSYRLCDVTTQVQTMLRNPASNLGFCVRRADEITAVGLTNYYTSNYSITDRKPVLEIQYYVPYKVSAATVTHATATGTSDGSISTTITGGPGTATYQWYDGSGAIISWATTQNISGIGYGWYGLKISNAVGNPVYMGFVVGVNCQEVSIAYNPGPEYTDDAMIYNLNPTTSMTNHGNYSLLLAANWTNGSWYRARSLLRFNLWVDPLLDVTQANLFLYGASHNPLTRSNVSDLLKITQPWEEMQVTHNNQPTSNNSIVTVVSGTSTATENRTLDIKNFWNNWKTNNTLNYGMLLQLQLYNDTYTQMAFHSSDATTAGLRPNIQFKFSIPGTSCICSPVYAKLDKQLRGVNYPVCLGSRFQFYYGEEYTASTSLTYTVRNLNNTMVMSSAVTPLTKEYGDNRYELNVGSLNPGTYILEVVNEKNEKFYLRFTK